MKNLRVAIIGYGRSGRDIHRHLLTQMPDLFTIVAFVEKDAQRKDMIKAENPGVEILDDYSNLIGRADIDLVVNASFSHQHAPISRELLANGLNVLTEKPAASGSAEFKGVCDAANASGKRYFIFQQYRFSPVYRKIKEVIGSGVLGRIVQVGFSYSGLSRRWDWQTVQNLNAGSLLNTGPHPVDMALDLMGFPDDVNVFCAMDRANTFGDAEDYVKLLLRAPGRPVADIEISASNAYSDHTYLIQGTRGTLKGGGKLQWKYYVESEEEIRNLILEPLRDETGKPIYCREKLHIHEETWEATGTDANEGNTKGLAYYRALHADLNGGAPIEIKHEQIYLQMRVMEESHRQNERTLNRFVNI